MHNIALDEALKELAHIDPHATDLVERAIHAQRLAFEALDRAGEKLKQHYKVPIEDAPESVMAIVNLRGALSGNPYFFDEPMDLDQEI